MNDNLILIEDKSIENFEPITSTRTSLEMQFGAGSFYEQLKKEVKFNNISIFIRNHLKETPKRRLKDVNIGKIDFEGNVTIINALINLNNKNVIKLLNNKGKFIAKTGRQLICARIPSSIIKDIDNNNSYEFISKISKFKDYSIKQIDSNCLIKYPWDYIKESGKSINKQYEFFNQRSGNKKNIKLISDSKKIWISKSVTIVDKNKTYFDSSNGPVIIDRNAVIEPFTYIKGPVYIGKESKINGARIYSNTSIGNNCNIGGEIQNSVIHEYTNKSHEGYLGHSIIGSWVNLGARTTNSDLKNTYGKIKMNIGKKKIQTNQIKFGCMIGDNSKTAIGSLIFTGIRIGVCGQLFGHVTEDIPPFTFYNNTKKKTLIEYDINKAIKTQARMMKRRDIKQNKHDRELLQEIYNNTIEQRKKNRVKVGNMKI